ncbi:MULTISPECIES: hypothetical protein [Burkholderiaceae]|uniref:hypothetical protein n=1 Tax=Burkholderiaceae TaxID=119060 RepID=UPI00111588F0|nr:MULTISPECIES: hypothetical protein [Burkholderiaceae]MCG1018096.1 hypothetical protein [Mycetohabitans sp. B4]
MSKEDSTKKSMARFIANLMNPPTGDETTQIIEDYGYVDNYDARSELNGLCLTFGNGKRMIEQVVRVDYYADEVSAMPVPIAKKSDT